VLELMSYALTGLAALVIIAACFAYSEEFSLAPEKHKINPMDEANWPCLTFHTSPTLSPDQLRRFDNQVTFFL
jgi:hypothetical protein